MNFGSLVPWKDKSPAPTSSSGYLAPLVTFRREVDRIFDDFFAGLSGHGLRLADIGWQGLTPTVDIEETDKGVVVTAELPGLDEKDFEVTLTGDVLTIKGEKKAEHEQRQGDAYYMERRFGSFSRSVRLPFEVKDEKVAATYDKGVLTLHVPKPADAQRTVRRIEIKPA
jgi:HSP20 family protein